MDMGIKRAKKSQLPYEISTLSIGEIIAAKADAGDKNAAKVIKKFSERSERHGKRTSNFRRS